MKVVYVRDIQVHKAGEQFLELVTSMCDLPNAVVNSYDHLPQLLCTLKSVLCEPVAHQICDHLCAHVQHFVQYVTYPDQYTLINWSQITREFLNELAFDSKFCDLWKAHVHLCMLHAQANWEKKWDQEQACWFRHAEICEMLQLQFETWLQEKSFDQDVTIN